MDMDAKETIETPTAATDSSEDAAQKRVAELEASVKEKEAKYLYLYAEFDNYKKRAIKERMESVRFAAEPLATEVIPVLDNLERALVHAAPAGSDKALVDGLKMVLSQFKSVLEKNNIVSVSTVGQVFDPNVHEAVGQEVSDKPPGTVLREELRGYTLNGRLLRAARVFVSQNKTE